MRRKLFCFGYGYTAAALDAELAGKNYAIAGTHRAARVPTCERVQTAPFDGTAQSPSVRAALAETTHVLVSVPPGADGDLVIRWHAADLAALPQLQWVGYLSTIGVYGDTGGGWVDETSPVRPASVRARRRAIAEAEWQRFGAAHDKRVEIFRLPGIYGPGRSALDAVKNGTARRIVKAGQVFNRVHVDDIARLLACAIERASFQRRADDAAIYNVVDDEPAPPQDVVAYAASLLGLPAPPETAFADAVLSAMGASFYTENKRVRNARIKSDFAFALAFPTYRHGLSSIAGLPMPDR